MNILFVNDNRDLDNWGCRATSIALSEIITSKNRIQSRIGKKQANKKIPIGTRFLCRDALLPIYKRAYYYKKTDLFKFLGLKEDILSHDPEKSVNNVLQFRKNYQDLEEICRKIEESEKVIINGEGSMIFREDPRRDLLFQMMIIHLAKYFKKQVFYVNAMVSDSPLTGRNIETSKMVARSLKLCSAVSLRDPVSKQVLDTIDKDINSYYVPDALFSWFNDINSLINNLPKNGDLLLPFGEEGIESYGNLNFDIPYICISDGSGRNRSKHNKRNIDLVESFSNLTTRLKDIGIQIYLVSTGGDLMREVSIKTAVPLIPKTISVKAGAAILANAQLFISGRFHPSIMASLGGTPSIFLNSNSHKTISLQQILGYEEPEEFPFFMNQEDHERIFKKAKNYLSDTTLRERIIDNVKMRAEESYKIIDLLGLD